MKCTSCVKYASRVRGFISFHIAAPAAIFHNDRRSLFHVRHSRTFHREANISPCRSSTTQPTVVKKSKKQQPVGGIIPDLCYNITIEARSIITNNKKGMPYEYHRTEYSVFQKAKATHPRRTGRENVGHGASGFQMGMRDFP